MNLLLPLGSLLLCSALAAAQDPGSARPDAATAPRPATGQSPRAGGAAPSDDAFRYGSPPTLAPGTTEPQMWPAADAEGWAKPVLIPWQRTFDDALEVSKKSGAPVLVCVNMDGEIASEHFAGVRYRDPATAKALEPYVCVIASVYRHTTRDYDEAGRRVHCPRFGTVTCAEHIANEVELYAKYFEGKRISPRHIMLGLEGTKQYDVYYSWDTQTVFTAFAKGVEGWPPPTQLARDGMSMPERASSADIVDRIAVEQTYQSGDHGQRVAILRSVIANRAVNQNDILRMAIFDLDLECARLARAALAQSESEGAIDVIAEALKVPLDATERAQLVAAAERLGEQFPRARTLAALHRGLGMNSSKISGSVDVSVSATEYAASVQTRGEAIEARPKDPVLMLDFAESLLARAGEGRADARLNRALLEDARIQLEDAAKLGLDTWRLHATLAAALDQLGQSGRAMEHALNAVEGGMWGAGNSEVAATDAVKVRVLALFAQARQEAIRKAYREKSKWPPEWLADINAAYGKLAAHPLVSEDNLVSYYDFLNWLGGTRRAGATLDDALAKFPESAVLHDRLRGRLLWEKGPAELEREYSKRVAAPNASPQESWFAGYASLVAAENFRRRKEPAAALAAYGRGIELYERNHGAVPEGRDVCDHFIALAHAGLARVQLERGDLQAATDAMLAAFQRRTASTGTMDGLDITPGMTALMLKSILAEKQATELSSRLNVAMDALDPALFAEPDFARQRGR